MSKEILFLAGKSVWVTGHNGMLGSALVRSLKDEGANLLLTSRSTLDLTKQAAVYQWMEKNRPEFIFHIAAKVGGIYANANLPGEFLFNNLLIQANVIDAAYHFGVKKLIFVASNCVYPISATQPLQEESLLSGRLEDNVRFYAVAKISGIELCRAYKKQYNCDFISVIPPNLYGPGDNYHPMYSHVVAGIMRRAHEAKISGKKELYVWGDGTQRRELLNVNDLADAMKYLMISANVPHEIFNIGVGHDFSIAELSHLIARIVGFDGKIVFDTSKPNGTMGKLLDSSRIEALGWKPKISEEVGLVAAYQDFLEHDIQE